MRNGRQTTSVLCLLLLVHAGMLAWSAARHSPTLDEPAHLAAGLSHWQFGRFEIYRVNPPLPRMVAALPVLLVGAKTDWGHYSEVPGIGTTFEVGKDFVAANQERTLWLVVYARWACIPFAIIGGLGCFLWARQMFGSVAGLLAATLWCFSPNILGHGQLITPDVASAAFGVTAGYQFWHWLRQPTWGRTVSAGVLLGIAELTKTTLALFFVLWPVLWMLYRWPGRDAATPWGWRQEGGKLLVLLVIALYVLNVGYACNGSFRTLGSYDFASQTLAGNGAATVTGNRFAHSWLAGLPLPFPKDYVLGIDAQKSDFEAFHRPSYLRGQFRNTGWWYYYLYASLIKVPLGIWCLAALVVYAKCRDYLPKRRSQISSPVTKERRSYRKGNICWRDDMVLLLPPLVILGVVSSQTGFSHHFRYLLPAFPFLFVWLGQVGEWFDERRIALAALAACAVAWSVTSSLITYPHSLSYFNEVVGGPRNGHNHLIHSNIDWGQDLWNLKRWLEENQDGQPLYLAYDCYLDAAALKMQFSLPPRKSDHHQEDLTLPPGIYAISVNFLRGYPSSASTGTGDMLFSSRDDFSYFRKLQPVALAGYSIYIYEIGTTMTIASDVRP